MKLAVMVAAAALGAATLTASVADASTYTVEAITPIGSFLNTGLILNPGTTYDFSVVNPSTLWSAGGNEPYSRESTANGIDPVASGYGQEAQAGYTFNFGALVGEIGSYYFLIGTGAILSGLSGDLQVGYWDSIYSDNSGSQTLSITATPLPSTWTMLIAAFVGLGLFAYRGTKKSCATLAVA